MNSKEEIIQAIAIGLVVATFLLNTGHASKAIDLCKECLVLINIRAVTKEKQFGNLIYGGIYRTMFIAYRRIRDNKNSMTYGMKLLAFYRQCGITYHEGKLSIALAQIYWIQNKYVEARELCEKAITILRETDDREGEANAYGNLGTVFQSLGEYAKAKEHYERALAIRMEIGDRKGEAAVYGNLGTVFQSLGEYVKAKEYHEKALAIRMEIGDREGEAAVYGNLGTVFQSLGEYVKAKEYLEKALAIRREIGDRRGEAADYQNLGTVFRTLGEYVKAKEYLEKALTIRMEIGDRAGEAAVYGNLGTVFHSLSEYVKAKECCEKALVMFIKTGDREGEAAAYGNLGTVSQSLGEYVKAKECYEKALAIKIKTGEKAGEAAFYGKLGTVFKFIGKYRKSKEYLDKALAISIEIGDRKGEATCYRNLGTVFQSLGDNVKAKEYYEKALVIAVKIGDRGGEAANCERLGAVFQSLGEYVMAEEYLEKALLISKEIRNGEIEFLCYCFLTLTNLSQGKFDEAFFCLFRSIERCEELRGFNADNDHIKISFADMHVFPYQRLSRLLCDTGNPNNALYVVELGRARALADLMTTPYSAEKLISANPQSWTGIENVMKKKGNCTCLYISYHAHKVFLWVLKTSGVIHFRPITVDEHTLHTRLAQPATNVDEFFAIMAKSFRTFGILPEEVFDDRSLIEIEPEPDSPQEENLAALRQGKNKDDPIPSLTLFHKMLIAPVSDLLEDPEIIIVPDRNLYRVPFPALLDESGKYLSETFRIRIVPSLTTLKLIQDSPTDYHSQTGALIVGDPEVGKVFYKGRLKNFIPLPGARKEAEMIGRLLDVQPLLGQHATKQAVIQRINSVSLIHFAAHGDAERGEIALAPLDSSTGIPQEDDCLLKMSDISQIQLRAKLVVLSCCHSGRGQIRAEGVVGIARAFLGSGARSVLVALWALEDSATEQFMSRFYEHLIREKTASESVHEAMKWMRCNGYSDVRQWAPFMLIGDNVNFMFGK
ncbi:uncharacterized protein LOC144643021 [Oculina patagonica]